MSADSAAFDETLDGTDSTPSLNEEAPSGSFRRDVDLEAGQRVGEYVIESVLGRGAFGTVYRAVHPLIGKPAAVKVLSLRYSVDPDIVARFVDEARAVNRINHPSIIDIFSFGTLTDGRCYYVMELLDGEPLDVMLEGGPLEVDDALAILEPIAAALDAAHATGIAHRDLKPANVFVARHGDAWMPKLLDFGIAKLLDEERDRKRTASGATVGTPAYMAPEQCLAQPVDHRVDIYAFGVMAFEVVTGRLPFQADSGFAMMAAHLNDPPPAAHDFTDTVPPTVSGVLATIMAKEPDQRPGSCGEAMALLKHAAGVVDPRPAAAPRPERPGGSTRAVLLITGVVIAVAGAFLVLRDDGAHGSRAAPESVASAAAAPTEAPATTAPISVAAAPATAAPATAAPATAAPATQAAPTTEAPKPFKVRLENAPRQIVARMGDRVLTLFRDEVTVPPGGGRITLQAPRHVAKTVEIRPGDTQVDARLRRVPRRIKRPRTPLDADALEPWKP